MTKFVGDFTQQLLPQLRTDRQWDIAQVWGYDNTKATIDIVVQGSLIVDIHYLDPYVPQLYDVVVFHYGGGLMYVSGKFKKGSS